MKLNNISFFYKEYETPGDLELPDRELVIAAKEVATNAYAPYSRFRVGAAVRLESNIIVKGVNVENAAFPSGICAERSAISAAVSNYQGDRLVAIAIAAMNDDGFTQEPVPPCGNCRQVMAEEESKSHKKIKLILTGEKRIFVLDSTEYLLPMKFNHENLNPQGL